MADSFLRALSALAIVLAGWAVFRLATSRQLRRAASKVHGLGSLAPGTPAILYFTTPTCQPCKTVQRPALARLSEILEGELQLLTVDASQETELADYWGVLSVPTTFVIDSAGQPRRVNHGVASMEKLLGQLEEAEGRRLALTKGPGPRLTRSTQQAIKMSYSRSKHVKSDEQRG